MDRFEARQPSCPWSPCGKACRVQSPTQQKPELAELRSTTCCCFTYSRPGLYTADMVHEVGVFPSLEKATEMVKAYVEEMENAAVQS